MDIAGWIQVTASLATIFTIMFLFFQSRMQTLSTKNQVYQNFVSNSLEIDRVLIEYPQFRKYIYGNEPLDRSNPDWDQIMGIEELVVDVVENIEVFRNEIPEDRVEGWMEFVAQTRASSAYREFNDNYSKWYKTK